MNTRVLYLKAEQSVTLTNKKIYLEDVVTIYGEDKNLVKDVSKELLMTVKGQDKDYMVSILKIMEIIHKKDHDVLLVNLGEADIVVEYRMPNSKKKWMEYIKTTFVVIIGFFGAAFSIMTFNSDVGISQVFQEVYYLVLGTVGEGKKIVEISYSIGLTGGILIFYNHFTKKHHNDDPTPLEIQMRTYETEKNTAKIKTASREGNSIDAN